MDTKKCPFNHPSYFGCAGGLRETDPRRSRFQEQFKKEGIDETYGWNAYIVISRFTGLVLKSLAENGVGRPFEYEDDETWTTELLKHADSLLKLAEDKHDEDSAQCYKNAQEAYQFIAEHLGSLWW